jgi:excisionase family DNA binding protein
MKREIPVPSSELVPPLSPPKTTEPRLVNVPTAAANLGISVGFLRTLISKEQMPSVRIGRRLLVRTRDIDAVIDGGGLAAMEHRKAVLS